jgi:glycosyltransferase involved in cell wall biosynthesis
MAKIRVLHIITRFLKGGTEKNVLYSMEALDKNRYSLELIVGKNSDLSQVPSGMKVNKVNAIVRSSNPLTNLKAMLGIYGILKKNKYHVAHTHQANAGMAGRLAAMLAGVPIIIHGLHGSTFYPTQNPLTRRFYILLERIAVKFTTCFTCVGYDLRDRYLKVGVGKKEDYHIIRSGIELEKFYDAGDMSSGEIGRIRKELGAKTEETIIGVVAALEPRKGHIYMIEVAKRLKDKNVKIVFVGDGWYRGELEKKILEDGLEDIIKFLGHRDDVEKIMGACDILVLTSLWEGLPQVLVQGAAVGKPLVSFAVEGANEVIKDGVNGFIVPIKDVDTLTEKLRYLIENPDKAREIGKKGREVIGDEWEIPKMQEKVRKLYDRLVEGYL